MRGMRTYKGHAGNHMDAGMLFDYAGSRGSLDVRGLRLVLRGVRVCAGCAGGVLGVPGSAGMCRDVPGVPGVPGSAGECRAFAGVCLHKFCHFVLRFVSCCIDKIL